MDLHDAWAAGLFEGEGSITRHNGRPAVQLKMTDEACVRRFASVVNRGRVYGPYENKAGEKDGYPRKDFWLWIARTDDAEEVLRRLWVLLSETRRARAVEVFANVLWPVEVP